MLDGADATGGGADLPDQSGHAGEFLKSDGTNADWASVAAAGAKEVGGVDDITNESTGYKTIKTLDSNGAPTSTDATFADSDILIITYKQLSGNYACIQPNDKIW